MTATRSLSAALQHVNRTLLTDEAGTLSDAELVRRFVERRDEAAFAALVRRYGLLVFGVCRRVLRHEQDAEDAFQATFLILARNAAYVERTGVIGNWLYGVAYNVSRKAKTARYRRAVKEAQAAANPRPDTPPAAPDDLSQILDSELGALPEKYRAAIVLCDLLGFTTQEAATEVGCPLKTLGTRLNRGRALLARRLSRRGIGLSAALVSAALGQCASAAVPRPLQDSAVHNAISFVTGSAAVPPAVAALTQGVSNAMLISSFKYVLLVGVLLGAGVFASRPVIAHLHAAQSRNRTSESAVTSATHSRSVPPRTDHLRELHRFLISLLPWEVSTNAGADDKKDDKPKPLSGVWVKKEGEMKIEFAAKEMKLYPHGENKVIVVICDYTRDKNGVVKAKITSYEGKEEAKKALSEKVPIGTEFTFKWKKEKDKATLDELKGDKIDQFKSLFEGDFEEKN